MSDSTHVAHGPEISPQHRLGPRVLAPPLGWDLDDLVLDAPRDLTPLITTLRWSTLAIGLLLTGYQADELGQAAGIAVGVIAGLTLWRTLRPIAPVGPARRFVLDMALDLPLTVVAVILTGAFESPFALTTVPVLFLAAYRGGYLRGSLVFLPAFALIAVAQAVEGTHPDTTALIAQATLLYVVTTALGGFTRSVLASAEESARAVERRRSQVDMDAERMKAANDLLLALYDVTQHLSASLDLGEVVASTQRRFRDLFDYTAAAIVVRDDSADGWRVELAEGVRLPASLPPERLPWDLADAMAADGTRVDADLVAGKRTGCSPYGRSALYAPLRTPDGLVGMLALEHSQADHFRERDVRMLDELTKPLALALDNARWFGKLRSMGAESERARIARDLHDRFAQSLAYIGFELERLGADEQRASLLELRDLVRELVAELRDMLHELRAGVDDVTSLGDAIRDHAKRFADRTDLAVHLEIPDGQPRLAIRTEQELWRIVQEALTNVERHAHGRAVWISWAVRTYGATLTIRDDGRGFRPEAVARDRFGLVGIRERADAVGAKVEIRSRIGAGTELVVDVPVTT